MAHTVLSRGRQRRPRGRRERTSPDLEEGARIGADFRLERRLGGGTSGDVWAARRISDRSHVAIKIASRALIDNPTDRARFAREAKLAQEIDSDYVVRGTGFGVTEGGVPYLVLEYLEGETLAARLDREGALEADWVLEMVRQLALALDAAHELDVVHRDLKPSNIFLLEGDEPRVKVLDFGMAKRDGSGDSFIREEGFTVGTPAFMSPEQLRNRDLDGRADQWALGVTVYLALTGSLPFEADAFAELTRRITRGRFPPASAHAPSLPPRMDAWFDRIFSPEPDGRFATATEAYEALVDAFTPAPRRKRRHWTDDLLLFTAVAAATALAALAALSL